MKRFEILDFIFLGNRITCEQEKRKNENIYTVKLNNQFYSTHDSKFEADIEIRSIIDDIQNERRFDYGN